jgi:hypothetical protein
MLGISAAEDAEDVYALVMKTLEGIEADFPIEDMVYADFEYCLMARQLNLSEADKFGVQYICRNPKCREQNTFAMRVSEIEFKEQKIKKFPVVLTCEMDGKVDKLEFMPYTVGKYLDLLKKGLAGDLVAVQASMVINKPYKEVYSFLYNQTDDGFISAMRELSQLFNWGVEQIKRKCKKCKADNIVYLDGKGVTLVPDTVSKSAGRYIVSEAES